ncbi:MAG: VOC family protein [Pseudomonadota bacterium]
MRMSLKTKISTPLFDESVRYYRAAFAMTVAEQWDKPDDKGAILVFGDSRDEALLEVYYSEEPHDFSGLSLQFRVDDLAAFLSRLPDSFAREGPRPRPWGSTYLYLRDPNDILIIVYEGGM